MYNDQAAVVVIYESNWTTPTSFCLLLTFISSDRLLQEKKPDAQESDHRMHQ